MSTDYISFLQHPNYEIKMNDSVIVYYNGDHFCIIPLELLKKNPILHTKITEKYDNKIFEKDVSIIYCPITSLILIHDDIYELDESVTNTCINLKKNNKIYSMIDLLKDNTHKYDIIIMPFNYVLKSYPDARFINDIYDNKISYPYKKYIKVKDYKIHPETIVYLVQYLLSETYKYKILIGNDSSSKDITGYDVDKNGIIECVNANENKIKTRMGLITPMYWYASRIHFPDIEVVKLDK